MAGTVSKPEFENHLHAEEPRWFAVYTHFKREKLALEALTEKGIAAYLPLQQVIRNYASKRKKVELPLISCYIFVKITKPFYVKVLETEYIIHFVRFNKNLISIPDAEIDLLKRILGENLNVTVEKNTFQQGDKVEITHGNLAGMKGTLVSVDGKQKIVVSLDVLGYDLQIEMPQEILKLVTS